MPLKVSRPYAGHSVLCPGGKALHADGENTSHGALRAPHMQPLVDREDGGVRPDRALAQAAAQQEQRGCEQERAALRCDANVGRLDVAVHDARLVRSLERAGDHRAPADDRGDR